MARLTIGADTCICPENIKRILVIRNDRIGDMVLSLPAIAALKKAYPNAHLAVLIRFYTQALLWNNPNIDEIIIDYNQDIFELARQIDRKRFDMAVVLYPSWRNGWLCWLCKIPYRVGTGYKAVGILFNQRVYIHRTQVIHHETDYCLKLVEKAVGKGQYLEFEAFSKLCVKEQDRLYAENLMNQYHLLDNSPLIGIHPGSGGSALNWTEKRYAELIDSLLQRYKTKVVLTGTREEAGLIERIIAITERMSYASSTYYPIINLSGQTDLGQLIALFSFYDIFIGSSTGPMHIAAALGKRVIALFPPLLSQCPDKWKPYRQGNTILLPEGIRCQHKKCLMQQCQFYNCMERITPQQVLDAIEKIYIP